MVTINADMLAGDLVGSDGDDTFVGDPLGINLAFIQTFEGNDSITGISNRPDLEDALGIVGSVIIAGEGNDTLTARGTVGVVRSVISAGPGDDLLDLQSGTGIIDGGDGFDTLVLAGSSSEFNFQLVPDVNGILVTGGATALLTEGIEAYQFDDLTIPASDIV